MRFDVAVIGAGPAGLSCAIAARALGLEVALVEAMTIGGQLVNISELDAVPPWTSAGTSGWDLANELSEHAQDLGVVIEFERVDELVAVDRGWQAAGAALDLGAWAVVVATGTVADPLRVPGADRLAGLGVSTCAVCDGPLFAGQLVAVIGGGDIAFWEATHLAGSDASVLLLAPTVEWQDDRPLPSNVEVIEGAELRAIEGASAVAGIRYADRAGTPHDVAVVAVFNAIGRSPTPPGLRGTNTR